MQVIGAFGEPIKCYGETTRRGRRQQVRWALISNIFLKYLRKVFYEALNREQCLCGGFTVTLCLLLFPTQSRGVHEGWTKTHET